MRSAAVASRFEVGAIAAVALWIAFAVLGQIKWNGLSLSGAAWLYTAVAAFNLAVLVYRWIVVCPVCENGYYPGHPTEWDCHHCGLHISADDPEQDGSIPPWGARE